MSNPDLQVKLCQQLGTLSLDVNFSTAAPWSVLFGPSGTGKSTILRAILGLLRPSKACITVQSQVVVDTGERLFLPPTQRSVRWVSQRSALFPRMNVEQNLAFALGAEEIRVLPDAIDHFHLAGLRHKNPAQLSGGERQRVAVVRAAIAAHNCFLLLDEPFSGLDNAIRERLIDDLRTWLPKTPILSVTHDVGEAFLLNAEIIRLSEGRVIAQGPVAEVLAGEREKLLQILQ